MLNDVEKQIESQLLPLSRKKIAAKAIENSKLIFVETKEIAMEMINEYGPEHFIVCTNNNEYYIENIENAGSVFIGNYTPESAGDYASGTNHTLPTNGYSKAYSGVNLDSFLKSVTFQKISEKGIQNIGKTIEIMAEAEGLTAHNKLP
jgi:histidinol dehydrogenase